MKTSVVFYKKALFYTLFALLLCSFAAAEMPLITPDNKFTIDTVITGIKKTAAPYISEGYIVFTADDTSRCTEIAFDFENYNIRHKLERLVTYGIDNEADSTLQFYLLPVPENKNKISYRMIFDGLWTTDPKNTAKEFSLENGTWLSTFEYKSISKPITKSKKDGFVTFIHNGEPGSIIRLAGTFTNWDSFIYYMKETSPGHYELSLPLQSGTYYYSFYKGLDSIPDAGNPERVFTPEGRVACVLHVD